MLVRHLLAHGHRDLVVIVTDPEATVADLAAALEPARPPGGLLVDGRPVTAATPLDRAGIGHGATLARARRAGEAAPADAPPVPAVATLLVTGGPDAGRRHDLTPGRHRVGRVGRTEAERTVSLADPTVSALHLLADVAADGTLVVTDQGARNPTTVDGVEVVGAVPCPLGTVLGLGASTVTVVPVTEPGPAFRTARRIAPGEAPTQPWHRPQRAEPATVPTPLAVPEPPGPPPAVSPVGLVAVGASLGVAALLVVVLGSWTYALFALLGPVLLIAGTVDSRWRRRRAGRRNRRRRRADLTALARALDERREGARGGGRTRYPGPAAAVAVATTAGPELWARRPQHRDAFSVRVGIGTVAWAVPLAGEPSSWAADVVLVAADRDRLEDAAVGLVPTPGLPIAVVGPAPPARALVRAIVVQLAVAHGPADLSVAVLAGTDRAGHWDWCGWLPHAQDPVLGNLLAGSPGAADALAGTLVPPAGPGAAVAGRAAGPRRLIVIDDPEGLARRRSPARTLLRAGTDPAADLVPIVLVGTLSDVPAACRVVLEVDAAGVLRAPELALGPATATGTSGPVAASTARMLARFDDPEVDDPGRGLPDEVSLAALLGPERLTATGLAARWRATGPDPAPATAIGVTAEGPLLLDLAADGPHVLVAGTTGAGKSELLRSLVAGLAVAASPDHVTFVLVDFKGGSAFDACAALPHVTGVVTDLDEALAERALRCLHAELRHREVRLRTAGAADLTELRRLAPDGVPLPRLVVVVDEFATLAAELPEFVRSLVGVAQRGRSLGVHLVLATQRPAGSVSDHIRANTALRVALRVQSAADSADVVDAPDAVHLPRRRAGRALIRFGPGELVPVQLARATTHVLSDGVGDPARPAVPPVRVRPLGLCRPGVGRAGAGGDGDAVGAPRGSRNRTDLDIVVEAAGAAWALVDGAPPRRPWPPPLPDELPWPVPVPPGDPGAADDDRLAPDTLVLGWADDPDRQRQVRYGWAPAAGPLLAVGVAGSGTTTLAATVVLAAAHRWSPTECHVHVVELGAGGLVELAGLPHVGAVVAADDTERQRRLFAELADDLARRRRRGTGGGPVGPRRIVVVDGLGALRSRWDDLGGAGTWECVLELVGQGAAAGIHLVLTADGPGAVPHPVLAACRQRVVFRLADRSDHAAFGIAVGAVPPLGPGRALVADGPGAVQVARPSGGRTAAVAGLAGRWATTAIESRPSPVGVLPERIHADELGLLGPARPDGTLHLPVGVADLGLAVAHLTLAPGGHALVAGPPRSGRSTALATITHQARRAGLRVLVVSRDGAPWRALGLAWIDPDDGALDRAVAGTDALLVAVDDADRIDEAHPVLTRLAEERRAGRHLVAAGRPDRLRAGFGHWLRELRADGSGLLLAPDPDLDGELLGVRLPRRSPVAAGPGRAWLTGGHPEGYVQVAHVGPAGS